MTRSLSAQLVQVICGVQLLIVRDSSGARDQRGLGVFLTRFTWMSLVTVHPSSHGEISLVTNLDSSDTSGVTRCTQSVYLNCTTGSDSILHRTETASKFKSSSVLFLKRNDDVGKGMIDPSLENRCIGCVKLPPH